MHLQKDNKNNNNNNNNNNGITELKLKGSALNNKEVEL